MDYYEEIEDYPHEETRPRDPKVDQAIERLHAFFDASPQRVFYSIQIETSLEREFFHWITGRALLELGDSREITRIRTVIVGQRVNFYANRKHRYLRREVKAISNTLSPYSIPNLPMQSAATANLCLTLRSVALVSELKRKIR